MWYYGGSGTLRNQWRYTYKRSSKEVDIGERDGKEERYDILVWEGIPASPLRVCVCVVKGGGVLMGVE